ncbi:uncharacterized protein LOC113440197 [Pseudonaja textilis]|uniref:uncharacterized protein LOC113440197 n=1 Tax=Pseudonaja textilis TaxID=8673 RepID=UPI000EAA33DC|nr:uncharacterized protein LOC113440197 [Pseudonaja textilis]
MDQGPEVVLQSTGSHCMWMTSIKQGFFTASEGKGQFASDFEFGQSYLELSAPAESSNCAKFAILVEIFTNDNHGEYTTQDSKYSSYFPQSNNPVRSLPGRILQQSRSSSSRGFFPPPPPRSLGIGHSPPPLRKVTGSALLGERYFAFLSCFFSAEGALASCKFVARLLQGGVAARHRSGRLRPCSAPQPAASPHHNQSGERRVLLFYWSVSPAFRPGLSPAPKAALRQQVKKRNIVTPTLLVPVGVVTISKGIFFGLNY